MIIICKGKTKTKRIPISISSIKGLISLWIVYLLSKRILCRFKSLSGINKWSFVRNIYEKYASVSSECRQWVLSGFWLVLRSEKLKFASTKPKNRTKPFQIPNRCEKEKVNSLLKAKSTYRRAHIVHMQFHVWKPFTIKHENSCGLIITLHATGSFKNKNKIPAHPVRYTNNAKMVNYYYIRCVSNQQTQRTVFSV